MRICIFGAGAVGSHIAVRLALAGHDVSCVMRGPHLEAVKARGLTLSYRRNRAFGAREGIRPTRPRWGPQDFVISTLKATAVSSLATGLRPLLSDITAVVFAQNGIPWWYDLGLSPIIRRRRTSAFSIPAGRYARRFPATGSSAV